MLGLFGTLGLGTRGLSAQRQGIETAGHNLANVNNPAYARQRAVLRTGLALQTPIGPIGTGVEVSGIESIRDRLLDTRVASELSVTGYWEAHQKALQFGQVVLGQEIDRQASGAEGASTASGTGSPLGLAESLQGLFDAFQSVATTPTSLADRQVLVQKAQTLANKFNATDARLGELNTQLNAQLGDDVTEANQLLGTIAELNDAITRAEAGSSGNANDLRDTRQQKLEALSKLVIVDAIEDGNGNLDISLNGVGLVTGRNRVETLALYDAGGGRMLLRAASTGTPITPSAGKMLGTIEARDGALADLRTRINSVAAALITQVNAVHASGFNLAGGTGNAFFTGTTAADIRINTAILGNPSLFQASADAAAPGDNRTALAIAQLAQARQGSLGNQTFQQHYAQTVSSLGQSLASANEQVSDQSAVARLLQEQRSSISGVSLDEEMADLVKFQKAFAASAKLITTVDEMLETVVSMKR